MNKIGKAKGMYLAYLIRGNKILTGMVMGKITGTKSRGRKKLIWLRNGRMEKDCVQTANSDATR